MNDAKIEMMAPPQDLKKSAQVASTVKRLVMPYILDACCGGKMFWFDKDHKNVLFTDIRSEEFTTGEGKNKRNRSVLPDKIEDFRSMSHEDETFNMVVFDPPHLFVGENSYMGRIYGRLKKDTWEDDLSKGFSECFRVLKTGGFLIFKWNECDIPLRRILTLTPHKPLFGHPSGKAQKTHWVCFLNVITPDLQPHLFRGLSLYDRPAVS